MFKKLSKYVKEYKKAAMLTPFFVILEVVMEVIIPLLMAKIIDGQQPTFNDYKFNISDIKNSINNYKFYNGRPITKSMLAWWAFQNEQQELLPLETKFEIEHIYARNRVNKDNINNKDNIDLLGNKSLLEKRINIRASDYRFIDKAKYYCGYTNNRNKKKEGTKICELISLSKNKDFLEKDITKRNTKIIESFISYLSTNNLLNNA